MTKRIILALASISASHHAMAGAVATGLFGAGMSATFGFDPLPWIVGAFGGVVIRVKLPATSRADGLVNGGISVMLAGFGAPFVTNYIAAQTSVTPPMLLIALMLSTAWPAVLALWPRAVDTWFSWLSKKG